MSRNTYKTGAQAEYDAARIFNLELNEIRSGPRARNSPDAYGPDGEPIEIKKASLNKRTGYWQVSHLYKSKGIATRLIIQIDKTFYDIRDKEVLSCFFNQDTVTLRPNISTPPGNYFNVDRNTKLLKEKSTAVVDEGQNNKKRKEDVAHLKKMLNSDWARDGHLTKENRQHIEEELAQPAYV